MQYTILVVDDDDDDFLLLQAYIQQYRPASKLIYAATGMDAIDLLGKGLTPNLIFLDAHMPQMDGYEFLMWLMNTNRQPVPVIVWSGSLSEEAILRFYRAGANAVLFKLDAFQHLGPLCRHWLELVQLPHLR